MASSFKCDVCGKELKIGEVKLEIQFHVPGFSDFCGKCWDELFYVIRHHLNAKVREAPDPEKPAFLRKIMD